MPMRAIRPWLVRLAAFTAGLLLAPQSVWATDPFGTGGAGAPDAPSAQDKDEAQARAHGGPPCIATDDFFSEQVWAKVGEQTCLKCHHQAGDAAESALLLRDPAAESERAGKILADNRAAMARLAATSEDGQSRLLLKVTGKLDHGGGVVLPPSGAGYQILEKFVRRIGGPEQPPVGNEQPRSESAASSRDQPPFFADIQMLSPQRLLRRITLSLAARLPSQQELAAVDQSGMEALDPILDRVMQEDAFYERLVEGFNDVFLTRGYDGLPERVLSYDHFGSTRHWPQEHDLSDVPEEQRQRARYALTADYREAILREPLELIEYIVRNDRPFTELVTADYIMVSPYTARGYGIYDQLKDQFADPEDPFEYIPTRLRALESRNGDVQPSETGYYPHSGFLSLFHYLRRYPTTATNRNRKRARMYYQHFLGVDIMQLAPRVTDAAAVDAEYETPTMQAADCVVCHRTIDPVAGLFQDYNEDGYYGPRRDGWYTDMFAPGFEGEDLPEAERWRAVQWLGERTARDPRFATAMVEHVYYILMGRRVMRPPQDIEHPMFAARRRAYRQQRQMIRTVAEQFTASGFDLKVAFRAIIASPFYRADGLAAAIDNPQRRAQLEDIGLVRLLTPEQLERKLEALFGQRWGRLDEEFRILYGGIDSKEVTERMTEPSGAMGAIQRIMANDVACQNVARDFTTDPSERRLFPGIELSVAPSDGPEAEQQIREAIVHLHQHLLGRSHTPDHPEVERTYQLFTGIIEDARAEQDLDAREIYFCRGRDGQRLDDPEYTLRAWRAVVTYLLRQYDFLYE